jgi:hypothetical protein
MWTQRLLGTTVRLIGVALGTLISHVVITSVILPHAMAKVLDLRLRDYYFSTYARPFVAGIPFAAACYVIEVLWRPPRSQPSSARCRRRCRFTRRRAGSSPCLIERELVLEHVGRVLPFMRRFKPEKTAPFSLPERRRLPCF